MTSLSPYVRTMRRLQGEPVDRLPNQNIFMGYAAHLVGATYSQFARDYRVLVDASLAVSDSYHLDWVSVISDPVREASAFGAEVHFPEDAVPFCDPLLDDYARVDALPEWDPWLSPRTLDRLEAIQLLRSRVSGYLPIGGWVEGAAAEAADLIGVNKFLEDTILQPEQLGRLLERCNTQAIRFAQAQIESGADLVGIGDAVCSLLSPQAFETLALPYEQALVEAIHRAGGLVKLHICGNTTRLLPLLPRTQADIIDVDWMVDFGLAVRTCAGSAVNGNMDPVSVFLQGTPELVSESVRSCWQAADNRTFISAGCEIPAGTPAPNLVAHYETLCRLSSA